MQRNAFRAGRALGIAAVFVVLVGLMVSQWPDRSHVLAVGQSANLPAIFSPESTPTPEPTGTPVPTSTVPPTAVPSPTPRPTAIPGDSNLLVNGSFEAGWVNLPPVVGSLINQQPIGWTLTWLEPGTPLWDSPADIARGIAECLHKDPTTLPPNEWLGGPNALILDGDHTYKTFHSGASFGTQLWQPVDNLPAGHYRLTVPVQLHWQEDLDPNDPTWDTYTAESGAWILVNGQKLGQWVNARQMGDRTWTEHVVEFTLAETADVEVLLRFKSKYAHKDFFIDAVRLEAID